MSLRDLYLRYDDLCGRYPRRMFWATFAAGMVAYLVVCAVIGHVP